MNTRWKRKSKNEPVSRNQGSSRHSEWTWTSDEGTLDPLLDQPDLRHRPATACRTRFGRPGVRPVHKSQPGDRRYKLVCDRHWERQSAVTRNWSLHLGRLRVSTIPAFAFRATGTVRTFIRIVIVSSVFVRNCQTVVSMAVPVITLFTMMLVIMIVVPVPGMLCTVTLMLVMPSDATFDDMSMLTGMSVMRATSENRMQQHRRHRQNAGQGLKHEVFTALRTRGHAARQLLRHILSSARTELSLECETGQSR